MSNPKQVLNEYNLFAKKEYGQNFLKDPAVAESIVRKTGITNEDTVLEIGPGLGALTIPLAHQSKKVIAVEKDRQIIPVLKNQLQDQSIGNVQILNENIMNADIGRISQAENNELMVIGNLPYNISSQILIKLISERQFVRNACFMFQKELAERLISRPNCKSYGRLSVLLTYCSEISKLADISASSFFPKPKVDSVVIQIKFKKPVHQVDNEKLFINVIKAGFSKRRKNLRNALAGPDLNVDTAFAARVLEKAGIDTKRRAESLSVKEFAHLSNIIGEEI